MEEAARDRSGEDTGVERKAGPAERGSILFVARNCAHLTRAAVRSAERQDIPSDILVVDNASTDGTRPLLHSLDISLISLATQASLSACWNIGLQTFFQLGRKHVLVCNTDIELRPDAYRLLLAHGGPFVTCVSVDTPERMGQYGDREAVPSLGESPHPDFSCFLIRPEVTDKVGWFNEDLYPAFVEDCDYHVRMHRAGVHAVSIDVPFLHHGSATIKNAEPAERTRIMRGADRNRAWFKRTYGVAVGSPEYARLFEAEHRPQMP